MVERLPSLRGIEAFACVSEVLNLRVASERLHITVSAVSHRIQGLEAELGVKLFDRGRRGLRLTPEGTAFRKRLLPGLKLLQDATSFAQPLAQRRLLRISAPPLLHGYWLVPRLQHFLEDWPNIRIELLGTGRRRAVGCDVVIAPLGPALLREGATPLCDFHVTPMCSPEFAANHTIKNPGDLVDLPLIDFLPSMQSWASWFAEIGLTEEPPPAVITTDNQAVLAEAMVRGLGMALGSPQLFSELMEDGLAVCPLEQRVQMPPTLGILTRSAERPATAFAEWLRGQAEESFGPVVAE